MRWLTGVLIALTVYVLAYVVARPSQVGTRDWKAEAWDFWDECAAGPADDDLLPRRAP